jgi:Tfp pilus assembly protein PilN
MRLDFLHPTGPQLKLGAALLALGVVITGIAGWRYHVVAAEVDQLQSRLADVQRLAKRGLPRVREAAGDAKSLAQEVVQANAVLASLTVPWEAMFGELEQAASPNVTLLSIQPEASGRHVRLMGEARRFEDLLAYIGRLEATDGFANVFLANHEFKAGAGETPVTFSITAEWVGRP